jgi:hypothetical protein
VASSKEDLVLLIRRDSWQQGLSVRALARKYRVHRRLVRKAFNKTIDQWLVEDLDAPPKQRHTVSAFIEVFRHTFGRSRPLPALTCAAPRIHAGSTPDQPQFRHTTASRMP